MKSAWNCGSASASSGSFVESRVAAFVNREDILQLDLAAQADVDIVAEQEAAAADGNESRGVQLLLVVMRSVASSAVAIAPKTLLRAAFSFSSRARNSAPCAARRARRIS